MSKLEEFQDLIKYDNKSGHHRCSICNCVTNESIATEIGDFRSRMSFTPDPKDRMHDICIECAEVIQEQRDEYSYYDEEE
jgi:hypothetical protein